jgi:3',5'-cyclic AMP phosphodiesterase CpdA
MKQNSVARVLYLLPVFLMSLLVITGCGDDKKNPSDPPVTANFAVLSDTHVYDTAALGTNAAFTTYLSEDRKLLKESVEILDSAVSDLKSRTLDFILISGDLTKDGEKINHQLLASKLKTLKDSGKKIFVVPGNHDINNPDALSFAAADGSTSPVDKVTPADFKSIYADYGYGSAIYSDTNSLSYIAEPVQGIWLFAIDSCKYETNVADGKPKTSGAIRAATLTWVTEKLVEAKQKGKIVLGMMHHGVVEHFASQKTLFSDYIIDDYASVGKTLGDNGLNVIFTGHFHANDVTMTDFTSSKMYDIETGSLVTAPSPYRIVSVNIPEKTLSITTKTITATASHLYDFVSYSHNFLIPALGTQADQLLAAYGLDAATLGVVKPLLVHGFAAHYIGDENMSSYSADASVTGAILTQYYNGIKASAVSGNTGAQMLLGYVDAIWTDKPISDSSCTITIQ